MNRCFLVILICIHMTIKKFNLNLQRPEKMCPSMPATHFHDGREADSPCLSIMPVCTRSNTPVNKHSTKGERLPAR